MQKNYRIREFLRNFAAQNKNKMNVIFKDTALEKLYESGKTDCRKYKAVCKNKKLVQGYLRAVNVMKSVEKAGDLAIYSFLHYEQLRHQKEPRSSVRLVDGLVERLIFRECEEGIEVELIEIDSTHYGNKK